MASGCRSSRRSRASSSFASARCDSGSSGGPRGRRGVEDDGSGFRPISLAHDERSPESVDRVMAESETAGARIIKAPRATDWGGYSGYFAAPDGHLWRVVHNPAWDVDDA